MARATLCVLCIIIIPALGDDLGHSQRLIPHHGGRQLAASRISFNHHSFGHILVELGRPVRGLLHDVNTHRRSFIVGLHNIGRRHHMRRADIGF